MNAKLLGLLLAVVAVGLLATGSAAAVQSENPGYEKCYIEVCPDSIEGIDSLSDSTAQLSASPEYEKCYIEVCPDSEQALA
ncbi:hypothetical protein [Halorussus caseinilyticus]|uniref:Uncharacterized protein n=1 Tax=Halorussus caseinilyticus TaxID=3034025 RepID=A0ABD5WPR0_9EURY|nr:hypothetical protein [Halorussus sp. DT72]